MRFALVSILAVFLTTVSFGIELNEIMFDPAGNENTDEFIEMYNESLFPVDLEGWILSDGEGRDTIIGLDQGLFALPQQYVLILDPEYLTSGSTTYDGLVPANALVVTISGSTLGSGGLSNGVGETVMLLNPSGAVVDSHSYTPGNLEGRSDERILLSGGVDSTNWADAVVLHGTPGGRNSVTPPDHDLSIVAFSAVPPSPGQGESFSLTIGVLNSGLSTMSGTLSLEEFWLTPIGDSTALLGNWTISSLAVGDSLEFERAGFAGSSEARRFRVTLEPDDDRPENNVRELVVSPTGLVSSIVINEIMYSPDAGLSEWVELLNFGDVSVTFSGWSIGDGTALSDSTRQIILPDISLLPDSFLIVAADSSIFFEYMPASAQVVVTNTANMTLNNNGDSLLIWDESGGIIDRVDYRPAWGGELGVSLERISAAAHSNDPLNWASSLDSTGGTPGRVNTRSLRSGGQTENLLSLEPNPFSPDGDGRDDILAVRFRLEHADSRIDVKIYDVRGREVRRLASNMPAGFTGELLWDGTNGSGGQLSTGLYIVYLEALGKGSTRIQTARRVVALARPE